MLKAKGLGRGLASLIPNRKIIDETADEKTIVSEPDLTINKDEANLEVLLINPEKIEVNPHQPRKDFNQEELQNLVNSIKEHGIIQPLVVIKKDNNYQLVAGERRLRAAKIIKLSQVPAIIRRAEDLEKLELSLIENIQRQDLNPVEEAEAYTKLNADFNLTQEEIARRVGRKRSTIANILRVLQLPDEIKKALAENKITLGHAKVILEASDSITQLKIFQKIIEGNMTVKDASREIRKIQVSAHQRTLANKEAKILEWEDKLRNFFGQKVLINKKGGRGSLTIEFFSEEELLEILRKILK